MVSVQFPFCWNIFKPVNILQKCQKCQICVVKEKCKEEWYYPAINTLQTKENEPSDLCIGRGGTVDWLLFSFACLSAGNLKFCDIMCWISVTVTITVSSKIDHFTPLMIIHYIQSNSTASSNSMNCYCPSIWITFKFQIACWTMHFRKTWLQIDQWNFPLCYYFGYISENIFLQIVDQI